jgi:transcriptional regulator with XRE-family HTH domain
VRIARGKGLRETAFRAGINPAHLSRVERGEKQLSVDALYRLAGVLGLTELAKLLEPYRTAS